MNKSTLWLFFVLLIIYYTMVFGAETNQMVSNVSENALALRNTSTDLMIESRTRKRHGFHFSHLWGWHALAIAYWIKVKLIIVAFFVGSAVVVGLRYVWPQHKCATDAVHEGAILYDHPHSFSPSEHMIPYSLERPSIEYDHSFESHSFEPYSAYSGNSDAIGPTHADIISPTAPATHRIGRRNARRRQRQHRRHRQHPVVKTEEQIAEFMFSFLGLDSQACRRRFICEMEFRSRLHPITSMAFRIVGRGFFEKYTNAYNVFGRANSFAECAAVNSECIFIEENETDEIENDYESEEHTELNSSEDAVLATTTSQNEIQDNLVEPDEHNNNVDSDSDVKEATNQENLTAERRQHLNVQQHHGDRYLNVVAKHIMALKDIQNIF